MWFDQWFYGHLEAFAWLTQIQCRTATVNITLPHYKNDHFNDTLMLVSTIQNKLTNGLNIKTLPV